MKITEQFIIDVWTFCDFSLQNFDNDSSNVDNLIIRWVTEHKNQFKSEDFKARINFYVLYGRVRFLSLCILESINNYNNTVLRSKNQDIELLFKVSCENAFTDLFLFTRIDKFEELMDYKILNDLIGSLTTYCSKLLERISDFELTKNKTFKSEISGVIVILMITRSQEMKELYENPDDYNALDLGGNTYYETMKSAGYKLLNVLESKNQDLLDDISYKCFNYVIYYSSEPMRAHSLIDENEALLKYSPEQILDARISILSQSKNILHKQKFIEIFIHLESSFYKTSPNVQYRIVKLFLDKLYYYLEQESHMIGIIKICSMVILDDVSYLKAIGVDLMSSIITKIQIVLANNCIEFEEECRTEICKMINKLMPNIDLPGVDDMIIGSVKYGIIMKVDINDFIEHILQALYSELSIFDSQDNLNIKALRLFEVLKLTLQSAKYQVDGSQVLQTLINDFKIHNVGVQEQIICIGAIVITKLKEVEEWMIDGLKCIKTVYSKINNISDEIAQTVNYFGQYGWEHLSQNQPLIDSFVNIGITEIKRNNANSSMHQIQGVVFLQQLFINLIASDSLKPYIPEIISLGKTHTNDRGLLLILLWYDQELTMEHLRSNDFVFPALSGIITYVNNLKHNFSTKLCIVGLINVLTTLPKIKELPMFHLKAIEYMINILDKRCRAQARWLKEKEYDDDEYTEDSDEKYIYSSSEEDEDSDDHNTHFEYKRAYNRTNIPAINSIDEYKEFRKFVTRVGSKNDPDELKVIIKFHMIQQEIDSDIKEELNDIIRNRISDKTKKKLKSLLKTIQLELEDGTIVHRKVVKAARRTSMNN